MPDVSRYKLHKVALLQRGLWPDIQNGVLRVESKVDHDALPLVAKRLLNCTLQQARWNAAMSIAKPKAGADCLHVSSLLDFDHGLQDHRKATAQGTCTKNRTRMNPPLPEGKKSPNSLIRCSALMSVAHV